MSYSLWPHEPQHTDGQASLSITNSWTQPKPMSIELLMPSNHLILCCPLFLLPSIFPCNGVFSNEPALRIRWPKYWSFSFNISHSNEHPGLISFRMDWLDLLAVQGTLKSLLQHHTSKASILRCSALFTVQLSHPYMTTGKTVALARRTFVGKIMCRFIIDWKGSTEVKTANIDGVHALRHSSETLCLCSFIQSWKQLSKWGVKFSSF